jgi:carboxyl-terminal processing protease
MKTVLLGVLRILSRYGWTATLIILGLFAVGFTWSSSDELYTNIRLFDKAAITVMSSYVEQVDETELIKAGIDGMVSRLDHFSRYLSGPDYLFLLQETDGEFEGIGVSLEFHRDTLIVESVLDGTPASYQGLKAGDRILTIDGNSTSAIEISRVRTLLRGQRDTSVNLKVFRPGDGLFEFNVVRDIVKVKAIPYFGLVNTQTGYIRLARFSEGCSKEMRGALAVLKQAGAQSLIIDLRDNPGGLLAEATKIASMFLPEKAGIVSTSGRAGTAITTYDSDGDDVFQDGELVIIVNGQTASAAEILAGAIQDNDRGVIVGSPTFGKGLVQQILQFTENSALKLTTSKYYLPSGRCLQKSDWSTFELMGNRDSAKGDTIFTTLSGRPVFGFGGIMPDIYIDEPELSDYVEYLKAESCFFDFSLDYVQRHAIDKSFALDDSVIAEFGKFLSRHAGEFMSQEREAFLNLKEKLVSPNQKITSAMNTIGSELSRKENWRFDSQQGEIRRELYEAIIYQALGEEGLYRYALLPNQTEISEAIKILSDGGLYDQILASN